MKKCATCKKNLQPGSFYEQKSGRYAGKLTTECKSCCQVRSKRYYAENKEKSRLAHKAWVQKNKKTVAFHKAKSSYGISKEEYDALLDVCVICGALATLCIDHSHQSGRIRGKLCHRCNKGIGFFGDNPSLLFRAAEYVLGIAKPDIFAATYEPVT